MTLPASRVLVTFAALALLCLASTVAAAQERLALVVGNGKYDAVPSLDNPVSDSRLIARTLEQAGFTVTLLNDVRQTDLIRAIGRFGRDLRTAGSEATGLFYYAGHGVQSFGNNYLLPSDVALTDAADLALVGVEAQAVLRQMASAKNRTNIVILDACRNNPFIDIADMDDNGLAEMKAPTGTFLSYATAPGAVALDGESINSPFTAALAAHLTEPGVPIEQMFKSVRIDVLRATNGTQVPWDTSSLTRNFSFVEAPEIDREKAADDALWASVKGTSDPVQILLFLRANPASRHSAEATALLSRLIAAEASPAGTDRLTAVTPNEPSRAAPAINPDTGPKSDPVADLPGESEREMIERARTSGQKADYQAYLDVWPEGTYAELAAFEITILDTQPANSAALPVEPAPGPAPESAAKPVAQPAPTTGEAVTFDAPLAVGGDGVVGRTLEQLITGSPLFPPIEGLPEEYWKAQSCSGCHTWQRENLCIQAQTYLSVNAERALSKQHPYGGGFKANLRRWAENDCK